ncbi:MAG: hypothetical protein K8R53_05700 [Bacteroidales bacterium]|nr:hypothetical protein [Bacteroidales bacterium]
MNDLNYSYDGNQLLVVNDRAGGFTFEGGDFRDGTSGGTNEYEYDANGNMTSDENKGILNIVYNYLNLPEEIDFGEGNKIKYLYTATGTKLKKKVEQGTSYTTRHYAGIVEYDFHQLGLIHTSEGRITQSGDDFNYEYFIKDNIGNVRVTFADNGNGQAQILQEDHYYPFGMTMGGLDYNYGNTDNKYLHQGKELQEDFGLMWHDFGARMYDAQLGRWHCPDPMEQYYSPYLAMGNTPVNGTDPSGMWFDRIKGGSLSGFALYAYFYNMQYCCGMSWDRDLNQFYSVGQNTPKDFVVGFNWIDEFIWGFSDWAGATIRFQKGVEAKMALFNQIKGDKEEITKVLRIDMEDPENTDKILALLVKEHGLLLMYIEAGFPLITDKISGDWKVNGDGTISQPLKDNEGNIRKNKKGKILYSDPAGGYTERIIESAEGIKLDDCTQNVVRYESIIHLAPIGFHYFAKAGQLRDRLFDYFGHELVHARDYYTGALSCEIFNYFIKEGKILNERVWMERRAYEWNVQNSNREYWEQQRLKWMHESLFKK